MYIAQNYIEFVLLYVWRMFTYVVNDCNNEIPYLSPATLITKKTKRETN